MMMMIVAAVDVVVAAVKRVVSSPVGWLRACALLVGGSR